MNDVEYLKRELKDIQVQIGFNKRHKNNLKISFSFLMGISIYCFMSGSHYYFSLGILFTCFIGSAIEMISVLREEKSLFNMKDFLQSSLYHLESQSMNYQQVPCVKANNIK